MRVLDGSQFLVRIFLGESDRFHHTPLSRALLERLRREGFAGDTVFHGTAGFGASSVIHTVSLVELSAGLPVLIEVVDDEAHVDKLLPILDEMLTGGALVTLERVRVLSTLRHGIVATPRSCANDCPPPRRHANGSPEEVRDAAAPFVPFRSLTLDGDVQRFRRPLHNGDPNNAAVRSMKWVADFSLLESTTWRWWPRFVPDGTH